MSMDTMGGLISQKIAQMQYPSDEEETSKLDLDCYSILHQLIDLSLFSVRMDIHTRSQLGAQFEYTHLANEVQCNNWKTVGPQCICTLRYHLTVEKASQEPWKFPIGCRLALRIKWV